MISPAVRVVFGSSAALSCLCPAIHCLIQPGVQKKTRKRDDLQCDEDYANDRRKTIGDLSTKTLRIPAENSGDELFGSGHMLLDVSE